MGKRGNESDYESLRAARIAENKARFEMLGLRCAKEELNAMAAPARRPNCTRKEPATGPRRRSPRLNGQAVKHKALPLTGLLSKATAVVVEEEEEEEEEGEGQEGDHDAPVVVDEEMDAGGEGMGDVCDPVPGETAISAEEIVQRG